LSQSAPLGTGTIVLIAVLCSTFASAVTCVTCVVLIRYSLVPVVATAPAPTPKPALTLPATKTSKPPAPKKDATKARVEPTPAIDPNDPFAPLPDLPAPPEPSVATGPFAQPRVVATSALELLAPVLAETSFVGPNNAGGHQGLYNDLTRLQRASEAVAKDDGADPAASAKLQNELGRALDAAITRTNNIANRATESEASRQITAQLNAAFQYMKSQ
jgi:hypothetical protein